VGNEDSIKICISSLPLPLNFVHGHVFIDFGLHRRNCHIVVRGTNEMT
jgi:hypothetical protein